MPTKGKCWSCGEFAYLTGRLLQNLDDGHMEFHMICLKCAEYFAKKMQGRLCDGVYNLALSCQHPAAHGRPVHSPDGENKGRGDALDRSFVNDRKRID